MSDDTRPAAAWAGAHAFRAVAARLGDPAPGLLTAVSLPDAVVSSLMPVLPLIDFSPFDELPGAPLGAEGRPASTTGRAAGQASPPPAGEGVRPIRREPPAATSPQGGASAPPVFSLRRSGRSGASSDRANRPASDSPLAEATPARPAGVTQTRPSQAPAGAGGGSAPPGATTARSGDTAGSSLAGAPDRRAPFAAATDSGSSALVAPMRLLGDLADSILAQAGPDAGAGPDREFPSSAPRATRQVSAVTSPPGPQGETPTGTAPSTWPTPPLRRTDAQPGHRPPGAAQAPSPLVIIDALADELLADPHQRTRRLLGGPQTLARLRRTPSQTIDSSDEPSALSEAAHAPQKRGPWSPTGAQIAKDSIEREAMAGSDDWSAPSWQLPGEEAGAEGQQPLDADTLADLVNEALAEQARRHGVDLS